MKKIIVVEDQGILRDSISYQLDKNEYDVILKLADADLAYDACNRLRPDLVLMDVYTENGNNGIEASKKIKKDFPDIKIIIMTGMPEVSYIKKAKEANVDSFIYKNTSGADLLSILSQTLNGYHIFPQEGNNKIGNVDLTKRELEILQLICNGLDQKEISDKLCVSINTVKTHIASLLAKTGFDSVHKLAIYAVSKGYIITNNK